MDSRRLLENLALAVAGSVAMSLSTPASAIIINSPVPGNAYIKRGGLDWAWAYPLPAASGLDLAFQSTQGWRLPTLAELGAAPNAVDFLFPGANVPLSGIDPVSGAEFQATNDNYTGDGACATPYFSSDYKHCDWRDGQGQPLGPWEGLPGANALADQLVVRGNLPPTSVPGPASSLGVAAAVVYSRRLRHRIKAGR